MKFRLTILAVPLISFLDFCGWGGEALLPLIVNILRYRQVGLFLRSTKGGLLVCWGLSSSTSVRKELLYRINVSLNSSSLISVRGSYLVLILLTLPFFSSGLPVRIAWTEVRSISSSEASLSEPPSLSKSSLHLSGYLAYSWVI